MPDITCITPEPFFQPRIIFKFRSHTPSGVEIVTGSLIWWWLGQNEVLIFACVSKGIHIKLVEYKKFKLLPSRYDRKDGNIARRYAIEGRVQ